MGKLQKLWKTITTEPSPETKIRTVTVPPIYCMSCGNKEAGNDLLCPICREIRRRLREEHTFHLM